MDVSLRLHRALAQPTRARVLELVRRSRPGVTAHDVASRLGVHPNTARAHLDVLIGVGLVEASSQRRTGPGRPRRLFVAAPAADDEANGLLASALAGSLEPIPDGPTIAEEAGRKCGASLAAGRRDVDAAEPVAWLVDLLAAHGFRPEQRDGGIAMLRCPFRELALDHPRVVCGFHRGLLEGALDGRCASVELGELRPWVARDCCFASLTPRSSDAAVR